MKHGYHGDGLENPEHLLDGDGGRFLPSLDGDLAVLHVKSQHQFVGELVGHLLQPFGIGDCFGTYDDPLGSGLDVLLDLLLGADASSDLHGHSGLADDFAEYVGVVLLAESGIQVHQVKVGCSLGDPVHGNFEGIFENDLLAAGHSAHQLDDLVVEYIDCRDDYHALSSAKETKFFRNFSPDSELFSGWNWVATTLFLLMRVANSNPS